MQAIVLHAYGPASNLRIEAAPDPQPRRGEVLVRVAAVSINPIDWKIRSGAAKHLFPTEFPDIPGIDLAGIVREVGDGVTGFAVGDRVMAMTQHTYAELCAVKAADLIKIPAEMELTTAAALPLVTMTGDQLIRLGTAVERGQTVLVSGAVGGVGRSAVFAASEVGARVIAGVRGHQLDAARALPGVTDVVAIDDDDAIERLDSVDCVADTVGGSTAEKLIAKVKQGGVFACVTAPPSNAALFPSIQITPIFASPDARRLQHFAEAVRDGRLTIPIERILPLADAAQAQAAAEKGGLAKMILAV